MDLALNVAQLLEAEDELRNCVTGSGLHLLVMFNKYCG